MLQSACANCKPRKVTLRTNSPASGLPSSRTSCTSAGAIACPPRLFSPRHGPIGHGVRLAVQIPLARHVERIRRILDVVASVRFLVRGARIERQRSQARRLVHLHDRHPYIGPGEQGDHLDIAAFPLLLDIAAAIVKLQRFILRAGTIDTVETEVRRARALRPPPADKQLPELATRGIGRPTRPLPLLPARNHAPSAD